MYLAVYGLSPYVKPKVSAEISGKLYGLHVDETTYYKKTRLEFWISVMCYRERKGRYLTTIDIQTKIDIEAFIKTDNRIKLIDELKLADSETVFDATAKVLEQNSETNFDDNCDDDKSKTLKALDEEGKFTNCILVTKQIESAFLVSTHNMVVESGFSQMKTTETNYMINMTAETYDALRVIQDYWDVDNFEQISISRELNSSISAASERYREVTKKKQVENSRKRSYTEELGSEVHVFKRKSTGVV